MFPSSQYSRIFGNIACPSGASCQLPNCFFSHDAEKAPSSHALNVATTASLDRELESKRLKFDHGTVEQKAKPLALVGSPVSKETVPCNEPSKDSNAPYKTIVNGKSNATLPRTATRPISPPPKKAEVKPLEEPEVEVRLVPRKLAKAPAEFPKRLTFLKLLHEYITPLNDKVRRAAKPEIKALHLSANRLNKLVVDEEEKIAKEHPAVYENVLKQRLVALKKMSVEDWVKGRRAAVAKEKGDEPKKPPPPRVHTGMTHKEEVMMLSALISPQDGLDAHGYVTKLPNEYALQEAQAVLLSADGWEVCDRCGTRFQVFPDRRIEDGALTTGGECTHHYGKRVFPAKKKIKNEVPEPTRLSCCNEPVGSPGCTTHKHHVYKVSDAKRLSVIMPFIETPANNEAPPLTAICFDCEMGYTTQGLELLRLTAVSWPSHKPLVDVLVRPLGHLLDVNTRFSGVTIDQFTSAKPYDPDNPTPIRKDLRIVDSPYVARDLFLSHISPSTPVLGHALENDLNCIRLIHPTIVDTVILYPTRGGLPYRHGLKALARMHLGLDIQQGGAAGHDSFEDARTTGELIRFKVGEEWKKLREEGWTIREDGLYPPVPEGTPPPTAPMAPPMVGQAKMAVVEGNKAEKRTRSQVEEGEGEGLQDDGPPKKRHE